MRTNKCITCGKRTKTTALSHTHTHTHTHTRTHSLDQDMMAMPHQSVRGAPSCARRGRPWCWPLRRQSARGAPSAGPARWQGRQGSQIALHERQHLRGEHSELWSLLWLAKTGASIYRQGRGTHSLGVSLIFSTVPSLVAPPAAAAGASVSATGAAVVVVAVADVSCSAAPSSATSSINSPSSASGSSPITSSTFSSRASSA